MAPATRRMAAARHVGYSPIFDVAMGDAGADERVHRRCVPPASVRSPDISTIRSGSTSRRLSIGPMTGLPAMILRHAVRIGHQGQRSIQSAGRSYANACRFHAADLSAARAARIASTTRRGEIGECRSSTASGRSASFTALANRRWRRDGAAFADALDTEHGIGRWRFHVIEAGSGTSVGPGSK